MSKNQELKQILDITISKAKHYQEIARDFIDVIDILIIASSSFVKVMDKRSKDE